MSNKMPINKGARFAFGAAFLNALVGVLSMSSFNLGLSAAQVAFYKCTLAWMLLSTLVLVNPGYQQQIKGAVHKLPQLLALSFCGFFCLYFFETAAYQYEHIGIVVFALLGGSTIVSFVASSLLGTEALQLRKGLTVMLALIGLIFFTLGYGLGLNIGLAFALLAGGGYGLFLVLNNYFNLRIEGIPLLWYLSLLGTLWLMPPFLFNHPVLPGLHALPPLLMLGLAPTIGGFYCTTQALKYSPATDVQLFELAEPLIAALLAFFIFQQVLTLTELLGALFISLAILSRMEIMTGLKMMQSNPLQEQ